MDINLFQSFFGGPGWVGGRTRLRLCMCIWQNMWHIQVPIISNENNKSGHFMSESIKVYPKNKSSKKKKEEIEEKKKEK